MNILKAAPQFMFDVFWHITNCPLLTLIPLGYFEDLSPLRGGGGLFWPPPPSDLGN